MYDTTAISVETGQDIDPDVARASAGDQRAFERLYRIYVPRIYALCLKMTGTRARAEELTQDAFVLAWKNLPQFRGDAAFSTWLHRLAVNVVLGVRRTEQRQASREGEGETDYDSALALPVWDTERVDLSRAMATLPVGARTVFVLHDVEGYKHEEIATMLGITPGGSKAQLHRARQLLRGILK